MKRVFADSFYFFALFSPKDPAHQAAVAFGRDNSGQIVTTWRVLVEVAEGLAGTPTGRAEFVRFLARLESRADARIVPLSAELFRAGLDLYARRPDKKWSLTDCISFVVMDQEKIADALTGDHHFGQAGFDVLLDPA